MENMSIQELQHIITEELFFFEKEPKDEQVKQGTNHVEETAQPKTLPKTVHLEVATPPQEELKPEPLTVRGKFEKGILVLHEEQQLKPEVMEMLVNMINAVGHSMNEVGLLSSKELEGRTLTELYDLNAHIVLKFGRVKHPINALPASDYQIHTEEETEYLFADALSVISEDKVLKGKLWNTLKVLFNIAKKQ
ncbi:hypothetical protein [Algoriphagus persicinus]|uniref:hypothetical protein n=1 Tax=Algoriphagus persicinus TaxID=3108754 RepID=UPI002B3CC57F|nr:MULTISPECIES: hypothetical protein [unclassified Algoriphagus]MEB2781747.1 hypothetical protein [Algoriphagus sp. C2-6-M1]MEB2786781.1 hypothetical protein [Algoriphagus sp. E1-3-M2]